MNASHKREGPRRGHAPLVPPLPPRVLHGSSAAEIDQCAAGELQQRLLPWLSQTIRRSGLVLLETHLKCHRGRLGYGSVSSEAILFVVAIISLGDANASCNSALKCNLDTPTEPYKAHCFVRSRDRRYTDFGREALRKGAMAI